MSSVRNDLSLVFALCVVGCALDALAEQPSPWTLGAYAEGYYQWNFANPTNRITNYRGFDNRANTFSLTNAVIDAQADYENVIGRVALQVGSTPSTYYLAEPSLPGTPGANATGPELWKFIQTAYAGYRFPVGRGLLLTAGLFTSPIGPENVPVKDNWNYSRSTPFFALPFYHAGFRAQLPLNDEWTAMLMACNGWNSVVDNNPQKSITAQATYTKPDKLTVNVLAFTGVERNVGAPEGAPWRHTLDASATITATPRLSFMLHANGGLEPHRFGVSSWEAGAVYARFALIPKELFFAARMDGLHEHVPTGASAIFFPADWVSAQTATVDYRPNERVSIRLEYRHDQAATPLYFGGAVSGAGTTDDPFVPNRRAQDTVTLGVTTWI